TVRYILFGGGAMVLFLVLAGLVTGYSWAGGSFTGAFAAVGEGWAPASGPAQGFLGVGAAAGVVAAFGNLSLAPLINPTLTRGTVTTQEVLVTRESHE